MVFKATFAEKYELHQTVDHKNDEGYSSIVNSDDYERRNVAYGTCPKCNQPGTGEYWCKDCSSDKFSKDFKHWSSGDVDIDNIIKDIQLRAVHRSKVIEWIPFENLSESNQSKVFNWKNGNIYRLDYNSDQWERNSNVIVTIKEFNKNNSKIHLEALNDIYQMDLRTIYGITSPQPNQYMIVVLHAESKFIRFTQKFDNKKVIVERLFVVARALRAIHNANYVYTELSEKSILLTDCNEVYLDVMNVCKSIDAENNQSSNVHSFGTILNKFLVKFNDERMLELIHKCLLNDERLRPSIYNVVNDLQNIHNSYDSD